MERVSLRRGPAVVPETTLSHCLGGCCVPDTVLRPRHTEVLLLPVLRRPPLLGRRQCACLRLSAGRCPCRRHFPLQMAAAVLSTGSPSPCPGWRSSNNAEWRGWVTARCPTFSCYPGLRRAEKCPLLGLQEFLLAWDTHVDAGSRAKRVIGTSWLCCRDEWWGARE